MSQYIRLIKFVKPHITIFFFAGVCMILSSAFHNISLSMFIPLVNRVFLGGQIIALNEKLPLFLKRFIAHLNELPQAVLLNRLIIWFVGLYLLRNIFVFSQSYLMRETSQRVVMDLRNLIYKKLLNLSLDFYSTSQTGALVSRITYDTTIIQDAISEGLTDLIWQGCLLLFSVGMIIFLKIVVGVPIMLIVISFILLPMIIFPIIRIGKRLRQISKRTQEAMAGINNTLFETISGIRIVKAFGMEDYEQDRFYRQNKEFKQTIMKSNKRILFVSPLTESVGLVCAVLVLLVAGKQVLNGSLSLGVFVTFLAYLLSLLRPINRLSRVYTVNQQALAAANRIFEILDKQPTVYQRPVIVALKSIKKSITFEDAYFRYDTQDVLKDINLRINIGDVIAIVGPSGAGKTTLVNLIPRFYDPYRGSIKIDNVDITEFSLSSLRSHIGLVSQEMILFNDTVRANIAYGRGDISDEEIIKASQIANAHDFIMKMPKAYNTVIGERGFILSGGEKQRLCIARAVLKNPVILIFDEATSQLDSESELLVQEAIDRIMKNRTVLVIAHRLSTIKHANKIVVMEDGRIQDIGDHSTLINKGGLYKKLYDMQFRDILLLTSE